MGQKVITGRLFEFTQVLHYRTFPSCISLKSYIMQRSLLYSYIFKKHHCILRPLLPWSNRHVSFFFFFLFFFGSFCYFNTFSNAPMQIGHPICHVFMKYVAFNFFLLN